MHSSWESKSDAERADALARFFAGTASPDERTEISIWAATTAGRPNAADALRALWTPPEPLPHDELAQGWNAIASNIGVTDSRALKDVAAPRATASRTKPRFPRTLTTTTRRRVTAVVTGVLATGALATGALAIVLTRVHHSALHSTTAYAVYTTRPGQRATIDLSDGTRVSLNAASTLEVPRTFGVRTRAVRLTGHAAFDVAHADARPFTVDAAGTRTTVLGTSFGVRAYDANVRVAVRSGKVAVDACETIGDEDGCHPHTTLIGRSTNDAHAVLDAGDIASVSAVGRVNIVRNADLDADFAFIANRLVLTGAPLASAVADLNRWYNADIRLADPSVGQLVLEGSFPGGNLDALVQSLEIVLHVRVVRDGRVVTVYPAASEAH
jgi:ferric-dicitrate binding protein FerR (iron transport regulator)